VKLLKKTTVGILALVMSFSFFACDGETPNDSSPSASTPPASSSTDSSSGGEDVTVSGEGEKYLEGIVNAIRAAQTITLDIAFDYDYSDTDLAHGTNNAYDDGYNSSFIEKASFDATATFSKTADGYNAYIKMDTSSAYEYGEYPEENDAYSETVEIYMANGFIYGFNADLERWEKISIDEMLEYSDSEEAANGGITIALQSALEFYNFLMTGDLSEVYQHFGPVFEQYIVVQNNAYNFELNLVDDAKATIDYFTNLNYAQTLETYINSILVELGAETTIVEILDKIAAYGDYTMGEAYEELSVFIQEKTGMTINELKNKLLEEFDTAILEIYFPADQLAEILASIEEFKAMDVAELIEPYSTITVNDVIAMIYESSYNEDEIMPMDVMYEEAPTLEELIAELTQLVKAMTLEDVLASMDYSSSTIKTILSNITIDKLGQRAALRFNGYAISSIELVTDIDLSEGLADYFLARFVIKTTEKLALSNETTTITPPSDAVLIHPEDM
jgi:hypothetical protein